MKGKILQNWKSGITVSIVSVPLSLALAISSGATPTQGIITAFWAGLIAGIFGSSNFNIIGPTGALAGMLMTFAFTHGYQILPILAILSGILISIAYLFKFDKYIIFIPQAVIHGFTLGVAFIIGLGQLDNILGITNISKTDNFISNIFRILKNIHHTNWLIFLAFIASISFILIWNKKNPKIPGAGVIAFIGIIFMLMTKYFSFSIDILTIGDKYPSIHASLFENPFSQVKLNVFFQKDVWVIAIAVAVISILETLLSGQIASLMTKTKFNRNKEILGLALANIASGVFGGIPATAALARTALNIKSGANHKTSAIINAIFIGIISIFFINFFKLIPMFIIAAILVVVAINMVEKKHFIHLINNGKTAFFISLFVALLVIIEDPITGIIIGSIIALLVFVNKVAYGQTEIEIWKNGTIKEIVLKNEFIKKTEIDSDLIVYKISGTLTYINMPAHLETANKIKDNQYVILSLRHAFYADVDGIDYLGGIIEVLKKNNNQHILLSGINEEIEKKIRSQDFYKEKLLEKKIYKRTSEAISGCLEA
jgi:sulfate permease, SulP family